MFCVLMLHNVRIATFALHFLYQTTSEYLRNSRNSRRNLLQKRQNLRIHFPCEMNELYHLWERHYLQPRRHAHRPSSRQMTCTRVGAGSGRVPVRNCVLFLVSAVTSRMLGPRQAESQGVRQHGIRLQRQAGPDCLHEQSRFQVDVTEKEAEKKD